MSSNSAVNLASTDIRLKEEVFDLLKRRGPQCSSQVAVTTGAPLKKVTAALDELRQVGLIEPRPDHDTSIPFNELEVPWALTRSAWLHRIKTR